jgi:hypothetical protein
MFQVEVLSVVTPCSVVVGYQRFGGSCCLHLQGEVAGVRVRVTLQLTVGQSVSQSVSQSVLASSPSTTHDQMFALVRTAAVLSIVGRPP